MASAIKGIGGGGFSDTVKTLGLGGSALKSPNSNLAKIVSDHLPPAP